MRGRRAAHAQQSPHDARDRGRVRRSLGYRSGGTAARRKSRGRRARAGRDRRERVRPRARDGAMPAGRPADPDGGRAAHQQLPALGHRVRRGVLLRGPVAGLHGAGAAPCARLLRAPPASLRQNRRTDRGRRLLAQRIITALFLGVGVVVVVLFAPETAVLAVLGLLWAAGAWEWAQFARLTGAQRVLYALAVAAAM